MPKGYKLDMEESYPIVQKKNGTANKTSKAKSNETTEEAIPEESSEETEEVPPKHK
jgi:hypothetical protein